MARFKEPKPRDGKTYTVKGFARRGRAEFKKAFDEGSIRFERPKKRETQEQTNARIQRDRANLALVRAKVLNLLDDAVKYKDFTQERERRINDYLSRRFLRGVGDKSLSRQQRQSKKVMDKIYAQASNKATNAAHAAYWQMRGYNSAYESLGAFKAIGSSGG